MRDYRHTQFGWATIGIVACVALFGTAVLLNAGIGAGLALVFASLTLLVPLLFRSMTVALDQTHLALSFGIGVVRKRFALDDIKSYGLVRNPWYYGRGIKMIPGGWLYNVSGPSAVELLLVSGRYARIGTDEPDALIAALRSAIGERPSLADADRFGLPVLVRTARLRDRQLQGAGPHARALHGPDAVPATPIAGIRRAPLDKTGGPRIN